MRQQHQVRHRCKICAGHDRLRAISVRVLQAGRIFRGEPKISIRYANTLSVFLCSEHFARYNIREIVVCGKPHAVDACSICGGKNNTVSMLWSVSVKTANWCHITCCDSAV